MTLTNNGKKSFISDLNMIFALLAAIKGLSVIIPNYWFIPIKLILKLLGVSDIDYALNSLSSNSELVGILTSISIYLLCITIPTALFFVIKKGHNEEDHEFYTRRPSVVETLCAVGTTFTVAYTVTVVLYLIFQFILNHFGYTFYPPPSETPTGPELFPLYVVYLCVLPSLSEEFLIRGQLMRSLKKTGKGFAVIVSALFFMMMHNSVSNLSFSFFAGLCIGYFAMKFNSILLGIIIHFCVNLNATVMQFIEPNLSTVKGQIIFAAYLFVIALFSLTFFFSNIVIFGIKGKKKETVPNEKAHCKKRWIFCCPFFYIFILLFLICAMFGVISLFK